MALDKGTGALVWKTVVEPHPAAIITASPVIYQNHVYVGVSSREESWSEQAGYQLSFRGSVVALELSSGAIDWQFHTVPQGYTGGAVWGSNFAVDPKRGSLYATSGNNYSVPASVAACLEAASGTAGQLNCLDPADYVDAVVALDLQTGNLKWGSRLEGADTWTGACGSANQGGTCPVPRGPDYDFASGPNLFTATINGTPTDIVGAGQKSGIYWALNADDGSTLWATQVGPGGKAGGIQWGSAVDAAHIYVAINNSSNTPFTLANSTQTWNGGAWAALDPATGKILWQIPATGTNPNNSSLPAGASGQVSASGGIMFAASQAGNMVAIDGSTGNILWNFASGGLVVCGPSIVNGSVYWGSGYANQENRQLYVFTPSKP
jgi:polyvinyl alcohol dehydrogenase (cytochrome)